MFSEGFLILLNCAAENSEEFERLVVLGQSSLGRQSFRRYRLHPQRSGDINVF